MSETNVIFSLYGINSTMQCTTEDKMKDICKSYSTKINKNINSLLFLYEGNKVNFELSFKEQANETDRNNQQMKILVSECDEKNNLNFEKLDEIIVFNHEIEKSINDIKVQINNIIKASSNNPLNIQLKNINKMLNIINEDITKNNEKIKNLFSDNIDIKNNNNKKIALNRNLFGKIKSAYFFKILFSHLKEKIKLKVIKYNKKFQINLNIKFINYKFYSGKYIKYESNNKVKEYNGFNNYLLFEGEYLNGVKGMEKEKNIKDIIMI